MDIQLGVILMKDKKTNQKDSGRLMANILRIMFGVSIVVSIITNNYLNLFIGIVALFTTYLPYIIARKSQIVLPPSFQIVILSFIFAANYLGELKEYYIKYFWWDKMLHTLSGIMLGFLGFLLIYILNNEEKVNVYLSPFFMALFAFSFAVCTGALWEIFEFTMDSLFGFNMQKSGLVDTMWDLIVDTIGAIISSISGYIYVKYNEEGIYKRMFNKFNRMNPGVFRKQYDSVEFNVKKLGEDNSEKDKSNQTTSKN